MRRAVFEYADAPEPDWDGAWMDMHPAWLGTTAGREVVTTDGLAELIGEPPLGSLVSPWSQSIAQTPWRDTDLAEFSKPIFADAGEMKAIAEQFFGDYRHEYSHDVAVYDKEPLDRILQLVDIHAEEMKNLSHKLGDEGVREIDAVSYWWLACNDIDNFTMARGRYPFSFTYEHQKVWFGDGPCTTPLFMFWSNYRAPHFEPFISDSDTVEDVLAVMRMKPGHQNDMRFGSKPFEETISPYLEAGIEGAEAIFWAEAFSSSRFAVEAATSRNIDWRGLYAFWNANWRTKFSPVALSMLAEGIAIDMVVATGAIRA